MKTVGEIPAATRIIDIRLKGKVEDHLCGPCFELRCNADSKLINDAIGRAKSQQLFMINVQLFSKTDHDASPGAGREHW